MNRFIHRSSAALMLQPLRYTFFEIKMMVNQKTVKPRPKKREFRGGSNQIVMFGRQKYLAQIKSNKMYLLPLYSHLFIKKGELYKYPAIAIFMNHWNKQFSRSREKTENEFESDIFKHFVAMNDGYTIFKDPKKEFVFALIFSLTFWMCLGYYYFFYKNSSSESAQNPTSFVNQTTTPLQNGKSPFASLSAIHITQLDHGKGNNYIIEFEDKQGKIQEDFYHGNPNYLLSYLESLESNSFQKTKVYFEKNQYTIFQAIVDTFSLLTPFIGIAITYYIFKKSSPDEILSKISPKKTFKIKGAKDIQTKFKDVAGMEEAKKEITEFVDFLKHSEKYVEMGAKIPKGALLTGPPGTGKTMLARACAGEAGVSFFYISGSEFVEMFVGLGASKVRDLFAAARMEAPSIIFIDQIDAIGKKRETSRNEEKDTTLNQLLVQMDGFSSNETVIVMAATNRKDVLDSALTRPGRFDRMVEITLPEIKAREEIFMVHLKPLKVDPSKPLEQIAKRLAQLTPGFSGADIANLCNEAAIIATRQKKEFITESDFEVASERITAGYEKKDLANKKIKRRVAYHEAGHAVSGWFLRGGDPLVKLTIIPRSKGALGYAQYLPKTTYLKTKDDLIDQVAILLGGLTSEEIQFSNISSGGSDDLQRVYSVTRKMIAQFGFGRLTYNVTLDQQNYVRKESQYLSKSIDQMMLEIVQEAKVRCRQVLQSKKQQVKALAQELLAKQTINSQDIRRILGERPSFD